MELDATFAQVLTGLEIGTAGVTGQSRLRDDLGMDSAEIIDMICGCETAYGVSIPDDGSLAVTLERVRDVLALVRASGGQVGGSVPAPGSRTEVLEAMDQAEGFDDRCVQTIEIGVPLTDVYAALFEVAAWPRHLPHVHAIDLIYDDGQYQEFRMSVASEGEQMLHVRSVRNCRPGIIEFFQPEPPPYLRHHGGVWRFTPAAAGATRVEVTHVWNLGDRVGEFFPDRDGKSGPEQVRDVLAHHSELALGRWKTVLEERVAASAARLVEAGA
ncbi:SRPBCC family protein [Kribbella sp. CA-253562]|uniref:SRPBCC family protein n=1 Tax=Kribbella sp. CA-253562 TaxID=3239942 RepID=UPI003D900B76